MTLEILDAIASSVLLLAVCAWAVQACRYQPANG